MRYVERYSFLYTNLGRFSLRKKNPEISVGAKVEFPIGKKLFHLVVNPGTVPVCFPPNISLLSAQEVIKFLTS